MGWRRAGHDGTHAMQCSDTVPGEGHSGRAAGSKRTPLPMTKQVSEAETVTVLHVTGLIRCQFWVTGHS